MSDSDERMLSDDRPEQPTARSNCRRGEVSNADLFHFWKRHEREDKWDRGII